MKEPGRIHQLLPACEEAKNRERQIAQESVGVFNKPNERLDGYVKTLRMEDNNRAFEEAGQGEAKEIVTTVIERLKYETEFIARSLDAQLQLSSANQAAIASIELPGGEVIDGLPATFLLDLEKWLTKKREDLKQAPTYDGTKAWEKDSEAQFAGVRKTKAPETKNKTEKQELPVTLFEGNDKHPPQVELKQRDIVVGKYETTYVTGRLSPAEKNVMLGGLDKLLLTVKRARALANEQIVDPREIGEKIWKSILAPVVG
jgi:hypothetical protein